MKKQEKTAARESPKTPILSRFLRRKQPDNAETGGLVVGYDNRGDIENIYYLPDDVHSLTVGATRSGKSRCIALQSVAFTALAGESMLLNDPKGELYAYCHPYLRRLGYEVICLDFKNPLKSSRYNFLQPVIDAVNREDNAKAIDLVWDITASLVGEAKGERIWTDGEASVIAGAIMSVVFDNKDNPKLQNFTNVYHFVLNMCRAEGNDMLINKYIKDIPDNHPAKGLFGIAQIAPSRTRGSFFTAALTTLRLFTNENIYNQTIASDFVLADTGSRKRVIFIILPDEKTTFYSLASLFVYQHYVALTEAADSRGGRLKVRVNFLLDEFGNFTQIPAFSNMLTVGGGRGIRFNLFVQSFAQIEEKYGREQAQTITDNCHVWIYLKTANVETASQIAKKLGRYTTSSYSRSASYNSGAHNTSANLSNSMNLIARSLLTEDEILRIERPYALVMYSGHYPAIMRLPDISEWQFNAALGLGDKEHNRKLRELRDKGREARKPEPILLWGIWHKYSRKRKSFELSESHESATTSQFDEKGEMRLTIAEMDRRGANRRRPRPGQAYVNMKAKPPDVEPVEKPIESAFAAFISDRGLKRGVSKRVTENPEFSDEQKYIKERTDLF
jgi:type IV secretion system protein VirD4